MGKITPRLKIFSINLILFFFSSNILLAADFPAKNINSSLGKEASYFVGFYLYEATITAPEDVNEINDPGECYALKSNVSLGTPTVSGTSNTPTNDAPSQFLVGETIVTWTITDDSGNTDTDTQLVTITDNENPKITLGNNITKDTDAGQCTAAIAIPDASFSDNCIGETVSWAMTGVTAGNGNGQVGTKTFNIGTTTITYTVTDAANNTITESVDVIVQDNENPTITAPADLVIDSNPGSCDATNVSLGSSTTSDNCGVASVENDAPATFPLGETTVTWTVTDDTGNTATATQKITVKDNEAPKITAPADLVIDSNPGSCDTTNVSLGSSTTSDNCGVASVENDAPATFPLGETTVTWTVTDDTGNTATATQKITVEDNEAPKITAPADLVIDADPGNCDATNVSLGNSTTSDNCGIASAENDAPATFPLGETTVTWTVTDNAGNTATSTQKVTVEDNEAPTITAPADLVIDADPGSCDATNVALGSSTTTDNCGVASVENDAPASFPLGETTVTWTVTDDAGNTAEATQIITVKDNEAPTITAPADLVIDADPGSCNATNVSLGSSTTSDNCGVASVENDAPASFPLGETAVTWTVTDNAGNTNTATQIVTVEDNEKPTITSPADLVIDSDTGSCDATNVSLGNSTTTDNCGVASVENDAPATFPLGETTVTWTVTDNAGNTAEATQVITVEDNEIPTITAPADLVIDSDPGSCDATNVSLGSSTTTDNCGVASVENDAPATFPLGETTVTWTVTDESGNTNTVAQIITVEDNEKPTASNPAPVNVQCAADVPDPDPSVVTDEADNCTSNPIVAFVSDSSDGNSNPEIITRTYSVTDEAGNSIQVTQEITVDDTTNPTASNPAPVNVQCIADVPDPGPSAVTDAADNCTSKPIVAFVSDSSDGNSNPEIITRTYSLTDEAGNSIELTQKITVKDTQPPTIPELPDLTSECPLTVTPPTTTDNCDGTITGTTGLTDLTIDASETIYWYFTDASGNKIGPIEQEVIIDNTVAPEPDMATLPKKTIRGCQITSISELTIPTATDACEGTISGTLSEDFEFPYSFFGTNSITWEYIDSKGNISTQEQKIELVPETIDGGTIEGTFLSSTFQNQIDISACGDEISIDLELSGQIGTIVHWEKFAVNRGIWEIINNTSNSHTASFEEGGLESTYYRALVEVGSCSAYSESFYVRALPAGDAPTVTNLDDSDKYCLDDEVNLRATSNYSATQPAIPSDKAPGDFNQGQLNTQDPDSWLVDGNPGGFTAGGDSKKARNWSGTNDHEFGDITYDGGDGKFAIAQGNFYETKNNGDPLYDGNIPTTLESPILDLSNAGSASLDFDQAFYFADGDIALIEVSIDGGETYSLLREMHAAGTGVKKWFTAGTAASVSGSTTTEYNFNTDNTSISLEDYIGQSNVRIRWSFTGTSDKSVWAMDNIFVNKEVPVDTELEWTIGIGNPEEEPIETGETNVDITFTPQSPGIHQYGGTALINGCRTYGEEGTDLIDIYVSYAYAGEDIIYSQAECGQNTVQLNAYDNSLTANENAEKNAYPTIPDDCKTCDNPGTGETGTWTWAGTTPTCQEASFSDINDPNATFTAGPGTYTLTWTVDECTSDIIVTINNCDQVDFDGVDDHVDFSNNYNLSGDFSLEVWVKPESKNGLQTIFSKRDGNFSEPVKGYDLRIEDGIVSFNWDKSGTIASPHEINTNRWYHIALTHTAAGEYNLYIDGVHVNVNGGGSPGDNDYNAILGAMDGNIQGNSSNYFNGWMEELRIWNAALTQDQIHLMMNQRIKKANTNEVEGEEIPILVDNLKWDDLIGYYRMDDIGCGNMNSHQGIGVHGKLKNITSPQERTAPLPYIAAQAGNWWDTNTWKEPLVWDPPSSPGITGDTIAWNIVRLNNKLVHNPASTNNSKSIDLLALLDEGGTLDMQGANNTSGNGLSITRYFKLDGILDLNGESQLIQSEGSEVLGSGHIERDQQGTASSFNYNYWSSPVLPSNSSTYTVAGVMFDGTDLGTNNFKNINFGDRYAHADGPLSSPIKISNYWINAFRKRQANEYSQWERIGSNPTDAAYFLKPGEGYTMKGTYWVSVKQNKLQNYTFKGFPNNGDIELTGISADQNYLIGNPYPSAVNAIQFIEGHLKNTNPSISGNVFNGTIYYWDHYSGQTHYLEKYVGGYAAFNLSGGLRALSNDERINFESDEEGTKTPGQYIPVGQGFFINTASGDSDAQTNTNITGGTVKFKNEYRVFASEANKAQSQFLSPESLSKQKAISANKMQKDNRYKIRLQFNSPTGYIRELLVTADRKSTNGYDLGYDALLLDNSEEDMYWMINNDEFIIQAVPHFNIDQVLPLGLKIAEESEFSIKIKELENIPEGMNIYLKDKIDDSYFNLTQVDFKASLSPEIYNDRYEIVFYNGEEPEEEVELDEAPALSMGYSYNSRELHIKNPEMLEIHKLVIYSISGQEVHSFIEVPTSELITLELDKPLSSAVYIVRAYTNKGIIATQVIIKQ